MPEPAEEHVTKNRKRAAVMCLFCALALPAWLVPPGIRWGLPSEKRNELTFGRDRKTWRAPKLSPDEAENPWAAYPNYLQDGPERTGAFPRSAFNPVRSYHPDEYAILKSLSGMRPSKFGFDPGFFGWPAFHIYLTGVGLKVASFVGAASAVPDMDHYFQHPAAMARLYIVGRAITLLFAAGCVIVLWRAADRLFGPMGGIAAALVLAVMPMFAVNAHWLTADVPMLFWISCVLLMCTHILKGAGRRWYVLSGIFLGLAGGTRYQGALAAFLIAVAHLMRETEKESKKTTRLERLKGCLTSKHLWLAAGISAMVFLLVNPYIVARPGQFFSEFAGEFQASQSAGTGLKDFLLFATTGAGPVLSLLTLGALVMALARRERRVIFVLIGFGVPAILLCLGRPVMMRYMMPVMLLCPLLVAWAFAAIYRKGLARKKRGASLVTPLFLLVVVMVTGVQSWSYSRLFTARKADTRTRAGEWIAKNIPEGATVGVVSIPWQFELPPLNEKKYKIIIVEAGKQDFSGSMPEYFVSSDLQFPPIAVLGPLTKKEQEFQREVFHGGRFYRVVKRFEAWPFGMKPILQLGPHDMRYVNPVIVVSRRRGS